MSGGLPLQSAGRFGRKRLQDTRSFSDEVSASARMTALVSMITGRLRCHTLRLITWQPSHEGAIQRPGRKSCVRLAPSTPVTAGIAVSLDMGPLALGWWVLLHCRTVTLQKLSEAESARAWTPGPEPVRDSLVCIRIELVSRCAWHHPGRSQARLSMVADHINAAVRHASGNAAAGRFAECTRALQRSLKTRTVSCSFPLVLRVKILQSRSMRGSSHGKCVPC